MMGNPHHTNVIAYNRQARFDYEILETYEAGIVLAGYEVKAAKTGRLRLTGSFVIIRDRHAYLINAYIGPYQPRNTPPSYQPDRPRILLLHQQEIKSLMGKGRIQGLTFVPIRVYTKHGKLKLEFGLAKGRARRDKRELIRKREAEQHIARTLHRKRG